MASKPRLYLFHGGDSWSSAQALRSWVNLFQKKYGTTTLHRLEGDELSADQLASRLTTLLQSQGLFPEPTLIILRRLTHAEKGKQVAWSTAVLKILNQQQKNWPPEVMLLIWEEKEVAQSGLLHTQIKEWENEGWAQIRFFAMPDGPKVAVVAEKYLETTGHTLALPARQWLTRQYLQVEKNLRLQQKVGFNESLTEDSRSWWLHHLLDNALLRAKGAEIDLTVLKQSSEAISPLVNPFDFAQSLIRGEWGKVRQLIWQLEVVGSDESVYFNLYAILRWQAKKSLSTSGLQGRSGLLPSLLGEAELIVKNFSFEHPWILELLVLRLQHALNRGEVTHLVRPKTLWLAKIAR